AGGGGGRGGTVEGEGGGGGPYTPTLQLREPGRGCARSPGRDGEPGSPGGSGAGGSGTRCLRGNGGTYPARDDPRADRRAPRSIRPRRPPGALPDACHALRGAGGAARRGGISARRLPASGSPDRNRKGSGDRGHRAVPDLRPLRRLRSDGGPFVHRRPTGADRAELTAKLP